MTDTRTTRKALFAALLIPMIAMGGLAATADYSFAQANNAAGAKGGGNNGGGNGGGGNGGGGGGERGEGSTSALDLILVRTDDEPRITFLKPRKPPRKLPPRTVQSVSIKDSCTCDMRTVRSGGQLITIRDCYKISGNTIKYCEPLAQ